jgi:hypothetical protein
VTIYIRDCQQQRVFPSAQTYLFENRGVTRNFRDNLFVEKVLGNNLDSLVLLGDAQFICLLVDVDRTSISILLNPAPKLTERAVGVILAVVITEGQVGHGALRSFSTCANGLGGSIDGPVLFREGGFLVQFSSLALDTLHERIVALPIGFVVDRGSRGLSVCTIVTRTLCTRILPRLAPFGSLGRVLEDKSRELVTHVNVGTFATGLAVAYDVLVLGDEEVGLRVLAGLAQHEFVNEGIEELAKLRRIVGTIDNITIVLLVERRLCTKFATEKLRGIRRWATERPRDIGHIGDNSLDTIPLAFNLRHEKRHAMTVTSYESIFSHRLIFAHLPVTVELVIDVTSDVNDSSSHIGQNLALHTQNIEFISAKT